MLESSAGERRLGGADLSLPVSVVDHPAAPQCGGFVHDVGKLAMLTAIAMVGRAREVGDIIDGAEQGSVTVLAATEAPQT
jgi:hypothetical protein